MWRPNTGLSRAFTWRNLANSELMLLRSVWLCRAMSCIHFKQFPITSAIYLSEDACCWGCNGPPQVACETYPQLFLSLYAVSQPSSSSSVQFGDRSAACLTLRSAQHIFEIWEVRVHSEVTHNALLCTAPRDIHVCLWLTINPASVPLCLCKLQPLCKNNLTA